jgi:hypothetical protein
MELNIDFSDGPTRKKPPRKKRDILLTWLPLILPLALVALVMNLIAWWPDKRTNDQHPGNSGGPVLRSDTMEPRNSDSNEGGRGFAQNTSRIPDQGSGPGNPVAQGRLQDHGPGPGIGGGELTRILGRLHLANGYTTAKRKDEEFIKTLKPAWDRLNRQERNEIRIEFIRMFVFPRDTDEKTFEDAMEKYLFDSTTKAEGSDSSFTGEWLAGDQPCYVDGSGETLFIINEKRAVCTARVTSRTSFRVTDGLWGVGLTAELRSNGLAWLNNAGEVQITWTRPPQAMASPKKKPR